MPHPKKISTKTKPLKPMSSPSSTSRCNTALDAEFTPELSKSDPSKREETDFPHQESKEIPMENLSTKKKNDYVI